MKLYGALILLMTLSAACGLTCYICNDVQPKSCVNIMSCPEDADRCFSLKDNYSSLVTKGCYHHCISPVSCCEGDLCNSGVPTGPSAFLLLLSSALPAGDVLQW